VSLRVPALLSKRLQLVSAPGDWLQRSAGHLPSQILELRGQFVNIPFLFLKPFGDFCELFFFKLFRLGEPDVNIW